MTKRVKLTLAQTAKLCGALDMALGALHACDCTDPPRFRRLQWANDLVVEAVTRGWSLKDVDRIQDEIGLPMVLWEQDLLDLCDLALNMHAAMPPSLFYTRTRALSALGLAACLTGIGLIAYYHDVASLLYRFVMTFAAVGCMAGLPFCSWGVIDPETLPRVPLV